MVVGETGLLFNNGMRIGLTSQPLPALERCHVPHISKFREVQNRENDGVSRS